MLSINQSKNKLSRVGLTCVTEIIPLTVKNKSQVKRGDNKGTRYEIKGV